MQLPLCLLRRSLNNGRRTLLTFFLAFTSMQGMAQFSWADWQYSVNGNNAIITRYTGRSSDVSIPSTINGLSVAYINIGAFSGNTSITNVYVPSSVFGVLNGGGPVPFDGCMNLVSITVDPLNPSFSSVDGVLFNKKQTSLAEYPMGRLGSYTVPAGVTIIASYAFDSCTNLTGVTIPNTVTNIRPYGFVSCSSLSSVTIPASVQIIGDFAFNGCDYLTNIFFSGKAPVSGMFVFSPQWVMMPKTMYYIPGTTGWGSTYAGYPTAPLVLSISALTTQGGQFSFNIAAPAGISPVVEAGASLDSVTWSPVQIANLSAGSVLVSDPDWANYPARFYRIRFQ